MLALLFLHFCCLFLSFISFAIHYIIIYENNIFKIRYIALIHATLNLSIFINIWFFVVMNFSMILIFSVLEFAHLNKFYYLYYSNILANKFMLSFLMLFTLFINLTCVFWEYDLMGKDDMVGQIVRNNYVEKGYKAKKFNNIQVSNPFWLKPYREAWEQGYSRRKTN